MPAYAYRARTVKGELIAGTIDGPDKGRIAEQLFARGLTPIAINAGPAAKTGVNTLLRRMRDRVEPTDVMLFFRQMYTLSRAGVPMIRALAGLQESAASPALARIIDDLRATLDAGRELSIAMGRHPQVFSPFEVSMVRVGESTGRLEDVFDRLAQHLAFEMDMRARIKQAVRYPTFVVIAMGIALLIANLMIIPSFSKMYEGMGAQLPLLTTVLIGMSNFTVKYWWLGLLIAAGCVFAVRAWVATREGRAIWDRLKLQLPIAGKIVTRATLARFSRSTAMSIKSGVPLVDTLNIVADVVDNVYVGDKIRKMALGVQRGESVLATSVATGIFSPVALQMIAVGDETGSLDDLLFEIAGMYERDVEYDVKNLASQIEPILIVVMAAFVLVLALGILQPMWGLGKAAMHGK